MCQGVVLGCREASIAFRNGTRTHESRADELERWDVRDSESVKTKFPDGNAMLNSFHTVWSLFIQSNTYATFKIS